MKELIASLSGLCLSCSRTPSWLDQKEHDSEYEATRSKRQSCVHCRRWAIETDWSSCRLSRYLTPFHIGLVSGDRTTICSPKTEVCDWPFPLFFLSPRVSNQQWISLNSVYRSPFIPQLPQMNLSSGQLATCSNWSSGLHSFCPSNLSSLYT